MTLPNYESFTGNQNANSLPGSNTSLQNSIQFNGVSGNTTPTPVQNNNLTEALILLMELIQNSNPNKESKQKNIQLNRLTYQIYSGSPINLNHGQNYNIPVQLQPGQNQNLDLFLQQLLAVYLIIRKQIKILLHLIRILFLIQFLLILRKNSELQRICKIMQNIVVSKYLLKSQNGFGKLPIQT